MPAEILDDKLRRLQALYDASKQENAALQARLTKAAQERDAERAKRAQMHGDARALGEEVRRLREQLQDVERQRDELKDESAWQRRRAREDARCARSTFVVRCGQVAVLTRSPGDSEHWKASVRTSVLCKTCSSPFRSNFACQKRGRALQGMCKCQPRCRHVPRVCAHEYHIMLISC